MKKAKSSAEDLEMRADYDRTNFAKLTRGKFHKQVTEASNVIILESKVAKEFPNSMAVNKALKDIISKRKTIKPSKRAIIRTKKSAKLHQASKRH